MTGRRFPSRSRGWEAGKDSEGGRRSKPGRAGGPGAPGSYGFASTWAANVGSTLPGLMATGRGVPLPKSSDACKPRPHPSPTLPPECPGSKAKLTVFCQVSRVDPHNVSLNWNQPARVPAVAGWKTDCPRCAMDISRTRFRERRRARYGYTNNPSYFLRSFAAASRPLATALAYSR